METWIQLGQVTKFPETGYFEKANWSARQSWRRESVRARYGATLVRLPAYTWSPEKHQMGHKFKSRKFKFCICRQVSFSDTLLLNNLNFSLTLGGASYKQVRRAIESIPF